MAYTILLAVLAFAAMAQAHMEMSFPPPLRSKYNPAVLASAPGKVDYSMTSPLSGAAQFPCKGYQSDLSDTTGAGASVVTWTQGASVNFTIVGGAPHSGGSCQAALSCDGGKTFAVLHSYIGSCPLSSGQNFDLTIPSDAPVGGQHLFAWIWYNEVGNREIYMNCASVSIAAGSATRRAESVAFSSRPDLFVANLANGCTTIEGQDVQFPDPGPDVTNTPRTGATPGAGFSGTCAAVNGIGGADSSKSSGTSGGASGSSDPPAASSRYSVPASSAPAASSPVASSVKSSAPSSSIQSIQIVPTTVSASGFATSSSIVSGAPSSYSAPVAASSTGTAPSATGTSTSGLTITADGQCGGTQTCAGSTEFGHCCSQWGFCGVTTMHCGTGCMAQFSADGSCGTFSNSTSPERARARAVVARRFFA